MTQTEKPNGLFLNEVITDVRCITSQAPCCSSAHLEQTEQGTKTNQMWYVALLECDSIIIPGMGK